MAQVELIIGPAGSGKTARVLQDYRDELIARGKEGRFGSALWITPSKRSRAAVLGALLGDGLDVCFEPQVVRFDQFADRLLSTGPTIARPIGPIAKRRLLRNLIDDLHRRERLKYFGHVAGTPGFLDLCESFIAELKREEIWPEDFGQACEKAIDDFGPTGGRKNIELIEIYAAYQQRLQAAGGENGAGESTSELYDDEGRFWSARTLMAGGHRGPYRDLTYVVVDGFTDFTRTQYEMLATLADWTRRMTITLALDRSSDRSDLFSKTEAARRRISDVFQGHTLVERQLPLAAARATAIGHLSSQLFVNPRYAQRSREATGLRILSCVRPAGEIETVARDVKRRLTEGTPPGDIVVAFRSLDGMADFVRETFAAAGIPVAVDAGPLLISAGAVRQVFALLELERDDWRFPQLLGVLNSTLIRPDWPGMADGSAPRAVSAALRSLSIDRGRETKLAALVRLVERRDDDSSRLALETMRKLADVLEPLRTDAVFATWVDRLLRIATVLRFAPQRPESDEIADTPESLESRGWDSFVKLVEEARNVQDVAGTKPRKLNAASFRRQLVELVAGQRLANPLREVGRVRVLSADQVRNLDVPHLYLCGLSEAAFPQTRSDDCLYGDTDRLKLLEHGVPLSHRERRSCEEMLLFYGVVTRARTSLTLSYPSVNDAGELLNPSPYVAAVEELFDPAALRTETCGRLDPVPATAEECLTEADVRLVATRDVLSRDGRLFATIADRNTSRSTALNIAAAADMAKARFATRGLTNYEGVLNDPRNIKRLRQRYGSRHEFSATELEAYAAHPFRYFLDYVLGLKPLADPRPATDYAGRGQAWHRAFASLHRTLGETEDVELTAETLVERLRQELQSSLGRGDSPLQWVLREIEKERLEKQAVRYGDQWDGYQTTFGRLWDGPPRPTCFEVPFGNMLDENGEPIEPQRPRVAFGEGSDGVYLRGQIDRIDVGRCGDRAVFNVIDYKLSRSPARFTEVDLALGRSLQLAIYAVATLRLQLVEAELFQLGFWSIEGAGFVCGIKTTSRTISEIDGEQCDQLAATLDRLLPELVASIRKGEFPIVPDDPAEKCNRDVAAVARVSSFRAVAEHLEKLRPGHAVPQQDDES